MSLKLRAVVGVCSQNARAEGEYLSGWKENGAQFHFSGPRHVHEFPMGVRPPLYLDYYLWANPNSGQG